MLISTKCSLDLDLTEITDFSEFELFWKLFRAKFYESSSNFCQQIFLKNKNNDNPIVVLEENPIKNDSVCIKINGFPSNSKSFFSLEQNDGLDNRPNP